MAGDARAAHWLVGDMASRAITGPVQLVALSACLLLAASYGTALEAMPYVAAGGTLERRLDSLEHGFVPVGLSLASQQMVLADCAAVSRSIYGRALGTGHRVRLLATCARIAAGITAGAPTHGYGWYVGALMAAEQGDRAGLNRQLAQAYATAPTEQWLAELRVDLVETHMDQIDPALLASHDRDLALLVRSQRGVRTIANRYVRVAAFRERITRIVERLPVADQKRFLANVRQQGEAAGPGLPGIVR